MPSKILTPFLCLGFLLIRCVPFVNGQAQEQKSPIPCETQYPLYSDKDNKPIWLDSKQLKERAIHCQPPKMEDLGRRLRINGQVVLTILVNPDGAVDCIKVLSGHPLLADAAVKAAKEWKFKPLKVQDRAMAFYGTLVFHISTSASDHAPDPCLCNHW